MSVRYSLDSLLLYDPDRSSSVTNVWVSRPTPHEEQALGRVFVISSINTPSRLNHEIITILQDEVKTHFTQSTEPLLEAAFEQMLAKVNQRLHMLIIEGVNEWVDHAHFLIGAFRQQQMVLTVVGDIQGYLLRDRRLQPVFADYQPSSLNPLRVFSTVWPGALRPGDRLLFCTPTLLDYFSLEKLRRSMLDHSPTETARGLEGNLLGIDLNVSIGALLFLADAAEETETAAPPVAHYAWNRSAPQVSMEELNARERQTEQLLSPSVWPAVKDVFQQLSHGVASFVQTTIFRRPPRRLAPSISTRPPGNGASFFRLIGVLVAGFFQLLWRGGRFLWSVAARTSRGVRRAPVSVSQMTPSYRSGRPSFRQVAEQTIQRLQRLPRPQQIIIVLALVLVFFLTTAIVRTGTTKTGSDSSPQNITISAIRETLAKADADLLYGGDEAALQELQTAEHDVALLPHRTKQEKSDLAAVQQTINQTRLKVAHMNVITSPTSWLNLAAAKIAAKPAQLIIFPSALALLDPTNGSLITVAKKDVTSVAATANTLDTGLSIHGVADSQTAALLTTDRASFLEFDTVKKTWKSLDAAFPYTSPSITAVDFFQSRAYVLDVKHNSIIRFAKAGSSLGTGVAWLKETADLRLAVNIAVDGSVYVAQSNGTVLGFLQGKRSTFALAPVVPALSSTSGIWTDVNSTNLYVTDPSQKRFLVFSKQGKLIDQYQSPVWTNLKDVVADEKTKTAFVLNGDTIYAVSLLH